MTSLASHDQNNSAPHAVRGGGEKWASEFGEHTNEFLFKGRLPAEVAQGGAGGNRDEGMR